MIKRPLSDEITAVFGYIMDVVCKEHPHAIIDEYAYITAALNCEDSLAYDALSLTVTGETISEMREYFDYKIKYSINDDLSEEETPFSLFDSYIDTCDKICKKLSQKSITSSILLLSIMRTNDDVAKDMRKFSVTEEKVFNSIKSQIGTNITDAVKTPKKHRKKRKNNIVETQSPIKIIEGMYDEDFEIEENTINLSRLARKGEIQRIVGYDKYYEEIFTILSKKNKNNVAICGKHGVGKTATAKNIANLINDKKCNKNFFDKILVEMDFSKMVIGTAFKGAFEEKFYSLLYEAKENGSYIFFIDNLQYIIDGSTKYSETDILTLLESLFAEQSISVIVTMTQDSFSKLQKKTPLGKYIQEVIIDEPSDDDAVEIINSIKQQYEEYHYVKYDDDAIRSCISLCRKYATDRALPDSAIDIIDMTGAMISLNTEEDPKVKELRAELENVTSEIIKIKASTRSNQYDRIDELVKKQISIKSQIGLIEKEDILTKEPTHITKNDICSVMSKKIDVPLEDITKSEKERLKGISEKIKEKVIGQDEAVDEVCRVVKRQRIGLNCNNRPSVLMFLGSTGTGKTYLAKQLAKEVFGDDKYFVRMDMSEYSDKTSVNKIGGSSPGYIGYDNDTYLVRELKKKKRFVLLLDEFEKSDEEVHNIFLQMFDEGRFTDNHGDEYSLKDVIIILTSNVGVAEASARGRAIGFGYNETDFSKSIIEKELKKKFKPEFLNRIQKIVFFNNLKDDNLRKIIQLEIEKVNSNISKLGYKLSEDIKGGRMVDAIYNSIKPNKEYGARPIVNEVQRRVEDKIVDYIIDNDVDNGHVFTYDELSGLD